MSRPKLAKLPSRRKAYLRLLQPTPDPRTAALRKLAAALRARRIRRLLRLADRHRLEERRKRPSLLRLA